MSSSLYHIVFCLLTSQYLFFFLVFGVTKPITKHVKVFRLYLAVTKRKKISTHRTHCEFLKPY